MSQTQEITGVQNRIKEPKDIPNILPHRVGQWLTQDELNFVIGVFLDDYLIDTLRDTNITNRDKVAQNICKKALDEGIIEFDGHLLYRIKPLAESM